MLVDSNVLIDVAEEDPVWGEWSRAALERVADASSLVVNPIIYAEVSASYARVEELERFMPAALYRREQLPWEAAFLAGKAHLAYRRRGGQAARRSPTSTSAPTPRCAATGCSPATRPGTGPTSPGWTSSPRRGSELGP